MSDNRISEDAHVSIRGVVNSSESLFQKQNDFINRFVSFEDRECDPQQVRSFWRLMDIPDRLLDLFTLADPWWDPREKRLKMQPVLRQDRECWEKVGMILLTVRRWIVWSDTRWARCGKAGRMFMRSVGTGLDSAIQDCLSDAACETCYLNCWKKASKEVRLMMTVAGLAAKPVEHFIVEMLKDDRLIVHAPRVRAEVQEKLDDLIGVGDLTWARSAQVADVPVSELRNLVLTAAMTSYGFLCKEALAQVDQEPFSLCIGDIPANVAALRAREEAITDERVLRIRRLLDAGFPDAMLVEGLEAVRELPFSTASVEQAHASAAVLMRRHDRYTENTMQVRSLLLGTRCLIRRPVHERKLALLDKKVNRLQAKRPRKAGPYQLFTGEEVQRRVSRGFGDRFWARKS